MSGFTMVRSWLVGALALWLVGCGGGVVKAEAPQRSWAPADTRLGLERLVADLQRNAPLGSAIQRLEGEPRIHLGKVVDRSGEGLDIQPLRAEWLRLLEHTGELDLVSRQRAEYLLVGVLERQGRGDAGLSRRYRLVAQLTRVRDGRIIWQGQTELNQPIR